jgi:hypothetical protein
LDAILDCFISDDASHLHTPLLEDQAKIERKDLSGLTRIAVTAVNKCPQCNATANPLRLFIRSPYICPKCGGRSVHAETWMMGILDIAAGGIMAAAAGFLYEEVEFLRNSTSWLIFCSIIVFALSVVLLRWTFGHLSPLSKDDPDLRR